MDPFSHKGRQSHRNGLDLAFPEQQLEAQNDAHALLNTNSQSCLNSCQGRFLNHMNSCSRGKGFYGFILDCCKTERLREKRLSLNLDLETKALSFKVVRGPAAESPGS